MNVDGFLINPRKVIKHLLTTKGQQPIAQIYGGKEATLLQAAQYIDQEYHQLFAGIELNTGCPSTTVMKVG
jgi:tRNA-dihydrouridine synthase